MSRRSLLWQRKDWALTRNNAWQILTGSWLFSKWPSKKTEILLWQDEGNNKAGNYRIMHLQNTIQIPRLNVPVSWTRRKDLFYACCSCSEFWMHFSSGHLSSRTNSGRVQKLRTELYSVMDIWHGLFLFSCSATSSRELLFLQFCQWLSTYATTTSENSTFLDSQSFTLKHRPV